MAPQARKIIFRAVKRIKKVESSVVREPKEEALASREEEHDYRRAVFSFVSSGITVRVPSHEFVDLGIVWKFAASLESYINVEPNDSIGGKCSMVWWVKIWWNCTLLLVIFYRSNEYIMNILGMEMDI